MAYFLDFSDRSPYLEQLRTTTRQKSWALSAPNGKLLLKNETSHYTIHNTQLQLIQGKLASVTNILIVRGGSLNIQRVWGLFFVLKKHLFSTFVSLLNKIKKVENDICSFRKILQHIIISRNIRVFFSFKYCFHSHFLILG